MFIVQKTQVLLWRLAVVVLLCATGFAQSAGYQPGSHAVQGIRIVRSNVHHDVSPPLRDLLKSNQLELDSSLPEAGQEAEPVRRIPLPSGLKSETDPDQVHQAMGFAAPMQLAPTAGLAFDGLGNATLGFTVHAAPPDTNGAVGLTQYVQ